MRSLEVPEPVRGCAMSMGDLGARWLAELPETVQALADEWDLALGDALTGGTASLVLAATGDDGTECVLKLAMPSPHDTDAFERSVHVHRIADGQGCVRLLRDDAGARAMLLERLGPNLDRLGHDVPEVLTTVTGVLGRFWRQVPADAPLPTGADHATWIGGFITAAWDELGRPCPRRVVDRALELCQSRIDAFDPATAVLVHGDAHGWNTLQSAPGEYRLVDPEGFRSEREHDLGVPMREYNATLLDGDTVARTWDRADLLAEACDADAQAVWEWGYVERVSTGLANVRDFDEGGEEFLEVAQRCL